MNAIKKIIAQNNLNRAAFFIGNGVNRASGIMPSWIDLLESITKVPFKSEGLTYTEMYDIIELSKVDYKDLKQRVANKLIVEENDNLAPHSRLMDFAKERGFPVLTPNFDIALARSIHAQKFHLNPKSVNGYYPWGTYFAHEQLENPSSGFGIWHVHGITDYPLSIRLGLSDYMGAVRKANELVHKNDDNLFDKKSSAEWIGYDTWLNIWFNLPLIFFGFGFGSDEIFLRWLLIERKKYFRVSGEEMNVWYISKGNPDTGTQNLLQNLGVEITPVDKFEEIYG